MEESLSAASPAHLVNQIDELQKDLSFLRDRRSELEDALNSVNANIDDDVAQITKLREQLDKAIATAERFAKLAAQLEHHGNP